MIDLSRLDLRKDTGHDRSGGRQPSVPPIGILLHHDDRSGFVAAIGEGRVKRASDYSRLESDRIWICDLPWREWMDRMGRRPNTRHNAWLRTPLPDLLAEWALQEYSLAQAADAMHSLIDRVVRQAGLLFEHYRESGLRVLNDPFADGSLNGAFSTIFYDSNLTRGPALANAPSRLPDALSGAWQVGARNASLARIPRGAMSVWMKRNRIEHALDVLDPPFPAGDWHWMPPDASGKAASGAQGGEVPDPLRALAASRAPALVQMSWRARPGHEAITDLFGWQRSSSEGARIRSWGTLEEALFLSNVADIEFRGALVCDGWSRSPLSPRLMAPWLDRHGAPTLAAGMSWSAGLAAECLLGGFLKSPPRDRAPSAAAVWAAWRDRKAMLKAALVFADAGIPVRNAYLGGLNVIVTDETLGPALDASWRAGLVPPLALVERAMSMGIARAPDIPAWGGNPVFMAYGLAFASAWRNALVRFDGLIDLPPDEVEPAFHDIESSI